MATQSGANVLVNYKVELAASPGTAATGGAATGERLRFLRGSPGLDLARGNIQSTERRPDGLMPMGRLGGKSVAGSYNVELSQGSFDTLIEALMRSTWVSTVAITQTAMTSITTTAGPPGTIVAAAGSWITQGVRVGDIVILTGHADAANNSKLLHVTAVTTTTVTVAETLTTNATPDATFTLTIQKKIITASPYTRRSFTIEEYWQDIDLSEQFLGCRVVSMQIRLQPNGMALATFGFVGMDRSLLASGASPYFTSPTEYTSIALVADDATIRYRGAAMAQFTGLELNFQITAAGQSVLGSLVSPDVYDNDMAVSGQLTRVVDDHDDHTAFDAETEFEIECTLVEPEAEPKSFLHLFFPRVKIAGATSVLGGDGPRIDTHPLMIGPKVAATGYDGTICSILTG